MKQVFLQKGKALLHDVPTPIVGENDVLVKVAFSFISSGTEIATLNTSKKSLINKFLANSKENTQKVLGAIKENGISGTISLIKSKKDNLINIGYSCSGQIIAVGKSVQNLRIGDYVACAGSGLANHAQVVCVPQNLVTKVKNKKFLKQASISTIGAIAMQGIRRAELRLGEKICVLGLGLIGQITVQLAKLSGCQVIGVDLQQDRLEKAKKIGTDFVLNPSMVNLRKEIDFITSHYGVDTTIITAASSSGFIIDNAMSITRRKGKVVLVGDVKLDFKREDFYSKEIDFLISCSYGPGRYDSLYEQKSMQYPYAYIRWTENRNMELFVNLIEQQKIDIDSLISQEFGLDQIEIAYSYLRDGKSLGALFSYQNYDCSQDISNNFKQKQDIDVKEYTVPKGKINVGFVGVGGFAKVKLLPLLFKNNKIKIDYVIDTDLTNLVNIAKRYEIKHIGNDIRNTIIDNDINMVVISTPHKFHFIQSIESLKSGKAVFVEKPAAVNFNELKLLKEFLDKNPNSLYCVDFNRSFSPFCMQIKKEISKRINPLIINYRMNVGFIPKEHWIQDQQNGGRIIGEACHIFDLFCFLIDSEPLNISVLALNCRNDDILCNDNVIINLNMKDGSCCSLTYTSIGESEIGKERMEIFFDGKTILMDDFICLKGYGLPTYFNKKVKTPDKGHENLLTQFIQAAKNRNKKEPISFSRIIMATKISLIADKLARQGGGWENFD
ncbi:zinc-binding dehydrogenase [Candidatus Dependentiae bacterium]|nr:zinc-binding dehydrogenase [Candidatus Dependentiae bacterium]